ncbi:MAG TPA: hypothetical protein VF921_02650 [Vicinamibacterales bacterium]
MVAALVALVLLLPAPDYAGTYDKGVPFARSLADAESLKDEWEANFANARVGDASLARANALSGTWRILVVAL